MFNLDFKINGTKQKQATNQMDDQAVPVAVALTPYEDAADLYHDYVVYQVQLLGPTTADGKQRQTFADYGLSQIWPQFIERQQERQAQAQGPEQEQTQPLFNEDMSRDDVIRNMRHIKKDMRITPIDMIKDWAKEKVNFVKDCVKQKLGIREMSRQEGPQFVLFVMDTRPDLAQKYNLEDIMSQLQAQATQQKAEPPKTVSPAEDRQAEVLKKRSRILADLHAKAASVETPEEASVALEV